VSRLAFRLQRGIAVVGLLLATALPLRAQAPAATTLGVTRTVPVATRALPRGASLTPADYQIMPAVVRPALGQAAPADSGWVTRRPVAAGEALVEPAVGPPALVASGQPVTLIADHPGVRLAIRGTAATSGSLGQRVWVQLDSGRRLRGVVTAPATVTADTTSLR
jgi:flagella basal body P-ring formation protein FlgA